MFSLLLLSALALRHSRDEANGKVFLAMPNTPTVFLRTGKMVDPVKLMFRRLIYQGRGIGGKYQFLLDGKIPVTTAKNSFRPDGLRPIVETKEVSDLRRRYARHRVWSYGDLLGRKEKGELAIVYAGKSLKISRIEQLAKVPIYVSDYYQSDMRDERGAYEVSDMKKDSLFLVIYDMPGSKPDPGDPPNYAPAYSLLLGTWRFERFFSTVPPRRAERCAIRKKTKHGYSDEAFLGLTHKELAWTFGWPMERSSLEHSLHENHWVIADQYFFDFKGDRVVGYAKGLPH